MTVVVAVALVGPRCLAHLLVEEALLDVLRNVLLRNGLQLALSGLVLLIEQLLLTLYLDLIERCF